MKADALEYNRQSGRGQPVSAGLIERPLAPAWKAPTESSGAAMRPPPRPRKPSGAGRSAALGGP
jgi:hypothetical protein